MKIITTLILAAALTGCTHYSPRIAHPLNYYNSTVNAEFKAGTWLATYNAGPTMDARNRLLGEFVWSVDRNYDRFETAFYTGKAKEDVAGDFLGMALGGVSTLIANEATKSILALVAATIVGGKASIDAHWYNMQTREAIVSQMRALRATQLALIEQGMTQPLATYPLTQGIIDVQAYYAAGSIVDALQAISQSASTQAVAARENLARMRAH